MDSDGPVGRDAEIAEIAAFLSAASGATAALVITGDAGIGKTAVWRHVLQSAGRSSRVLSCRPALAERPLAFSALTDLFGDVAGEFLPGLAGPRRRAVEAALLRDASPAPLPAGLPEAGPALPAPRVLARGILDGLRTLSGIAPVMVAVDDVQWLDRPSAGVLEFCFRRLRDEPVAIVLTVRGGDAVPLGLDRALQPDRLGHVRLGPLSLGATGEILRSRLGAALPRYALTRLYDACGGNPFYALECGRALADDPRLFLTCEPVPVPRSLRDLVRRRVRRLEPEVLRVGRLVAASSDPRERLIRAACDDAESWAAIDLAIDVGLIGRDGEVLRFTHPLVQSVLYADMSLSERRQAHRRLSAVAEDAEARAWHLALGRGPARRGDRRAARQRRQARGVAGSTGGSGDPHGASHPADTGQPARCRPRTHGTGCRLSLSRGKHGPQP